MQLTTPEMKEHDAVFPGENLFFYWRTSPSLWESKFREYQGANPIIVPIYWALHSEYNDQYDFGSHKPETDLKRLLECARKTGRQLIFALPLTPTPFLTNGGIPSYLARNLSLNKEGLAVSVIDDTNKINRCYSFYDPRIFQAFRKFAWNLGQYFSQNGIDVPIYGLDSMREEEGHIVSFFNDHSQVFEGGFNRYIKQIQDSEPHKVQKLVEEPSYENDLKLEYSELIRSLYRDAAQESMAASWSGELKICLLGASTLDIFRRSSDSWESESEYYRPLMNAIVNDVLPSSVLLSHNLKSKTLKKSLSEIVTSSFVAQKMTDSYFDDDFSLQFKPLVFFELFDGGVGHFSLERAMQNSGLKFFFNKEYPWSYKFNKNLDVELDDIDDTSVFMFFGHRLDQKNFNKVLKLFMNGMRVFLDVADLDEDFVKKLEVFYAENDLATERVNYISPIVKASLGEGVLITYDSSKLLETSLVKRASFWETVMKFLKIKHLKVEADTGIEYFWKTRSSNTYELNYEEIRRLSLYNPTSYKRKVHVITSQNFAFIKSLDQFNVELNSTPLGIDLVLLPSGSINLDFGYFE